ncbi:hypothetical protein [Nocardia sp. NRRL S-836]|uniref:hypothetical protein n=1 Tax=Nocardia sp. NRRL S-836 TaxID=1519492 RepID=UPI0006B0489D|nr:hypothetical protein [Nocardia sp. NRRL S-836]KOV89749.1 hypothetical protein ADL03_02870 [Nocardia sp. NRRL S-836]
MRRAVPLILAAALAACSATPAPAPEPTAPHRDVAALVSATTRAVSGKASYRFTVSAPVAGGVTAAASGVVRLTAGDSANLDTTTERPVQTGGKPERLHYVSTAKDSAFVELPPVFGLAADKPWVRLARADTDEFTNTMLGFYDLIYQQAVFTQYHLPIIAAGGTLRLSGEFHGRMLYTIDIDHRKAFDALPDGFLKDEVKLALDQNVTASVAELEVGPDGLPVHLKVSRKFAQGQIVDDAQFSDWGTTTPVAEPAPAVVSRRN